jgi:Type I phosphodiesterase / nucleotide pyrophosphatase
VCLAAVATGRHPDGSYIPHLTWYRRGERRFVEYGSSFSATLVEGSHVAINDAILNLNHVHLNQNVRTLFELVEDNAGVAASINFHVFRGRVRHPLKHRSAGALARRIGVFDAAYGPSRFFFGELFASDRTGASANLGVNTSHDAHAAAIGRWLVARDGFDFLVYYLPDVDMASHRAGPDGAVAAITAADQSINALLDAGGGIDAFLDRHAVVLIADHGQVAVRDVLDVRAGVADLRQFTSSLRSDPDRCQIALAASNRAGMAYRLVDAPSARVIAQRLRDTDGIDLVAFAEDDACVVVSAAGELRFSRGGPLIDQRGNHWSVDGEHGVLGLEGDGQRVASPPYPNPFERIACLLGCVNAGEVVFSAGPGVEFTDAGAAHHLGGGSHGSLAAADSLVPIITAGFASPPPLGPEPSITDVYGVVKRYFAL